MSCDHGDVNPCGTTSLHGIFAFNLIGSFIDEPILKSQDRAPPTEICIMAASDRSARNSWPNPKVACKATM